MAGHGGNTARRVAGRIETLHETLLGILEQSDALASAPATRARGAVRGSTGRTLMVAVAGVFPESGLAEVAQPEKAGPPADGRSSTDSCPVQSGSSRDFDEPVYRNAEPEGS